MAIIPDRRLLALAAGALLVAPLLMALGHSSLQEQKKPHKDYALIFGTVFGPDGRSRYGVPVKIRRADQKKALWEGQSDHQGEFAARVPPGTADYIVWADIKVPKGESKPETKVHIDYDERVDIGLHLKN
jgi:hypothetical protein